MNALALRHVAFEDLGSLEEILPACGYRFSYLDTPLIGPDSIRALDPLEPDLLVVLGGPMSVNDGKLFPWIDAELEYIGRRLKARRPILGICLGAQFMAKASGARIYPGPHRQIGWGSLDVTAAGAALGLGAFAAGGRDGAQVLHWHGETFDLPADADRIASDDAYANQAFALGDWGLALQFHLEARYPDLERWFAGHVLELSSPPAVDIPALREESRRAAPMATEVADTVISRWLAGAEG
jgi:GMP synthase (glutamine-hydrolysing)